MSPTVRKLVGQAVVQYLNGDRNIFNKWAQQAVVELKQQNERERLRATVREILAAKGVHYEAS